MPAQGPAVDATAYAVKLCVHAVMVLRPELVVRAVTEVEKPDAGRSVHGDVARLVRDSLGQRRGDGLRRAQWPDQAAVTSASLTERKRAAQPHAPQPSQARPPVSDAAATAA
jgi:hypothetical protein